MKPRQLDLPAGHHDANSASELLGVSKRKLLATLREVGFLEIDKNGLRGNHNLPRKQITDLEWAYTKSLTFGSGEGRKITHEYRIVVFTAEGFREVKKIIESPEHWQSPKPARATPPPSECKGTAEHKKASAETQARKNLLKELGLAS